MKHDDSLRITCDQYWTLFDSIPRCGPPQVDLYNASQCDAVQYSTKTVDTMSRVPASTHRQAGQRTMRRRLEASEPAPAPEIRWISSPGGSKGRQTADADAVQPHRSRLLVSAMQHQEDQEDREASGGWLAGR